MNVAQAFNTLGWRTDNPKRLTDAVSDYQRAFNLGPALKVDGDPGPLTRAALQTSLDRRDAGLGDLSEHFSASEFRCRCTPVATDCRRIWITRDTIRAAEAIRTLVGPHTPVRACRCPRENARVGGAKNSQHLHGAALDLGTATGVYGITVAQVRALGVFSGIGYYTVGGRQIVRHGDTRHSSPAKTAGTIGNPALWEYGAFGNRHILTPRPDLAKPKPPPPTPEEDTHMDVDEDTLRRIIREELHSEETARMILTGHRIFRDPRDRDADRITPSAVIELTAQAALANIEEPKETP